MTMALTTGQSVYRAGHMQIARQHIVLLRTDELQSFTDVACTGDIKALPFQNDGETHTNHFDVVDDQNSCRAVRSLKRFVGISGPCAADLSYKRAGADAAKRPVGPRRVFVSLTLRFTGTVQE